MYDVCVVGAGITGITISSIIAKHFDKKVIIIEKRDHIGGNCYDFENEHRLLVHKYGPHIFHTSYKSVWKYLSKFTEWIPYVHRVLAFVDKKFIPLPININTLEALFEKKFSLNEMKKWIEKERIKIPDPKNAEEMVISEIGVTLYNVLFKDYTKKQWGIEAKKLAPEVTARIPIRFNRNDNYFSDPYQGIPKDGYTKMFERMLQSKNIDVVLSTDYKTVIEDIKFNKLIYTGPIDYFFDYQFGPLPYRSIDFVFKTLSMAYFQPVAVVNYPEEKYKFTRITEFKHLTKQKHPKTTICYEYPKDYVPEKNEPFYPILTEENLDIYKRYKNKAKRLKSVLFVGRLAEYKYLNMDQCVKRAMDVVLSSFF